MKKIVPGTKAIKQQLRADERVVTLDKPEHIACVVEMNKNVLAARSDYQIKVKNSKRKANQLVLK